MISRKNTLLAAFTVMLALTVCCSTGKTMSKPDGVGLQPIDIKAPGFFWRTVPWKDGKIATMDGWGRFSELSFIGADKIRIKYLVNFPRWKVDNSLVAWPEADFLFITSAMMNHIAYLPAKFTKSFIPFLSGNYNEISPLLLDEQEGIMTFRYYPIEPGATGNHYVIYNYKEDKVLYETDIDEYDQIFYDGYLDYRMLLGSIEEIRNNRRFPTYFIYDWRTGKKTENELTKKMTQLQLYTDLNSLVNRDRRFFIARSETMSCYVKVDWDEDYKKVDVTPLNVLLPEGKMNLQFLLSADGKWAFSLLGIYDSIYGESLYKRAFYHIDDRYPGGVSFPVVKDYINVPVERGVFVQHPVHGMCYAVEYHKIEKGKDQLYLRLYKMDDVLEEINRQLLEKAQAVTKK